MAILWMDGFDHYTTGTAFRDEIISAGYAVFSTGQSATATAGQVFNDVGKAAVLSNNNRGFGFATTGSPTSIGALCHFQPSTIADTDNLPIFSFVAANNQPQITIACEGITGRVRVTNGQIGGTFLAESTAAHFAAGVYTHVEAFVTIDNGVGAVEVRINGNTTPVINISGVDTQSQSTNEIALVLLGNIATGGSVALYRFDNFFVRDTTGPVNNGFLGERRVETVVPNADTATEQWTPSTGADSFAMVDEIGPDDDTTYLESSTGGNRTVLDTANLADTTGTTRAVAVMSRARKTDAQNRTYRVGVRSGASETQSGDISSDTSYTYDGYMIANQDPNGTIAWTPANAQSAQIAIEDTTA